MSKCKFVNKLNTQEIHDIREHIKSGDVTFPLPDRKYVDQRFFHNSIKRAQRMYNMLPSTTQKISLSTYCKYRPKNFKLQGKIPFRQSYCERCQNFDNIVQEINKFMLGVPRTLADCVDSSLCDYNTFFPSINSFYEIATGAVLKD